MASVTLHRPGTAPGCAICGTLRGTWPMAHRGDRTCSQACERAALVADAADYDGDVFHQNRVAVRPGMLANIINTEPLPPALEEEPCCTYIDHGDGPCACAETWHAVVDPAGHPFAVQAAREAAFRATRSGPSTRPLPAWQMPDRPRLEARIERHLDAD